MPPTLLPLDGLIERVIAESDPAAVARARAEFVSRTGDFAPDDRWFEERTRAAFDFALCEWGEPRGTLLRAWAARANSADAACAHALGRAMRGLFRVEALGTSEERLRVVERLGGAPILVTAGTGAVARLREGDVFDGRVVLHDGVVRVLPGIVFHPAEVLTALDTVLGEARARGRSDPSILDGLLRMRMRFDRFTGMQARHVYRWDAIDKSEILAASWVRPKT